MTSTGLNHRYMVRNLTVPWDPSMLPSLVGWWDASDTATITSSSGAVSQWNDKSGNGRHLQQSTGASQPATGTRTVNGLNVLDFIPNKYLDIATDLNLSACTIYVVLQSDITTQGRFIEGVDVQYGTAGGHRNLCYINATTHNWTRYAGSTEVGSGIASTTSATQVVSEFSGVAGDKQYVNGTAGSAGNAGTNPLGVMRVGNDISKALEGFDGVIAEIALQSVIAASGDRTNWNNYCSRWGL